MTLRVLEAGPGVTLQDMGRPGYLAQGLSRGGAADPLALAEGAALLRRPVGAAIEMAGFGGRFRFDRAMRVALSGAPMRARLGEQPLVWAASFTVPAGTDLVIGGAERGVYGYLTLAGEIETEPLLGARSAHLTAGLGRPLKAGDVVPLGADPGGPEDRVLPQQDRFGGGTLRVLPSLQTELFPQAERARFAGTRFRRDPRGNRMGVRLVPEGEGFALGGGLSILSEVISPGDIQIPGDGAPFVLLGECQTTGGYPRIGTVIPADLPRAAQAGPGVETRFAFVTRTEALAAERAYRAALDALPSQVAPRLRDPAQMPDLLSYNLISGVTAGKEP